MLILFLLVVDVVIDDDDDVDGIVVLVYVIVIVLHWSKLRWKNWIMQDFDQYQDIDFQFTVVFFNGLVWHVSGYCHSIIETTNFVVVVVVTLGTYVVICSCDLVHNIWVVFLEGSTQESSSFNHWSRFSLLPTTQSQ